MKSKILAITLNLLLFCAPYLNAQDSLQYLSLSTVRSEALKNNEDMLRAQNNRQSVVYDRRAAFRSALPTVDASAGALFMGDQEIMGNTLVMQGAYLAGFTLSQPIYTGGKITYGNKMAKIGLQCSDEQLRQIRAKVIADADNAYFTWIAVRSKVRMLEAYHAQIDSIMRVVETGVNAKLATSGDLLRIQAKRSELDYQLLRTQNGEKLCLMAVANVMGLTLPDNAVPTDTIIEPSVSVELNNDISQRPEYALLEKNIDIKHLQYKMQIADYLPTIALTAGYTWYGNIKFKGTTMLPDGTPYNYTQEMKAHIPMAGLVLKLPILDWGINFQKIRKARLEEENAKLDFKQNTRLLSLEAQQAMQNLTSGQQLIISARTAREQAQENLRIMTMKYNNQLITLTDLMDAQSQWQQALSNEIEALTQLKIYETEYLRTTGRLE